MILESVLWTVSGIAMGVKSADTSTHNAMEDQEGTGTPNIHVDSVPNANGNHLQNSTISQQRPGNLAIPPYHRERPNSAPLPEAERLSGLILRLLGDNYETSNCGRTLRRLGDQMIIETEVYRRIQSYNDLERLHLQQNNNS